MSVLYVYLYIRCSNNGIIRICCSISIVASFTMRHSTHWRGCLEQISPFSAPQSILILFPISLRWLSWGVREKKRWTQIQYKHNHYMIISITSTVVVVLGESHLFSLNASPINRHFFILVSPHPISHSELSRGSTKGVVVCAVTWSGLIDIYAWWRGRVVG